MHTWPTAVSTRSNHRGLRSPSRPPPHSLTWTLPTRQNKILPQELLAMFRKQCCSQFRGKPAGLCWEVDWWTDARTHGQSAINGVDQLVGEAKFIHLLEERETCGPTQGSTSVQSSPAHRGNFCFL